eukprot:4027813-Amphidinium_carterae.1
MLMKHDPTADCGGSRHWHGRVRHLKTNKLARLRAPSQQAQCINESSMKHSVRTGPFPAGVDERG